MLQGHKNLRQNRIHRKCRLSTHYLDRNPVLPRRQCCSSRPYQPRPPVFSSVFIIGSMSKREFQTEVSQLLQLIVHSLYSHPEIFLRELISNSSDALDKLRHLTLTEDVYKALPFNPRVELELDERHTTLTIADTGIGMNEEDLVSHLGTIARSGTKNFLAQGGRNPGRSSRTSTSVNRSRSSWREYRAPHSQSTVLSPAEPWTCPGRSPGAERRARGQWLYPRQWAARLHPGCSWETEWGLR